MPDLRVRRLHGVGAGRGGVQVHRERGRGTQRLRRRRQLHRQPGRVGHRRRDRRALHAAVHDDDLPGLLLQPDVRDPDAGGDPHPGLHPPPGRELPGPHVRLGAGQDAHAGVLLPLGEALVVVRHRRGVLRRPRPHRVPGPEADGRLLAPGRPDRPEEDHLHLHLGRPRERPAPVPLGLRRRHLEQRRQPGSHLRDRRRARGHAHRHRQHRPIQHRHPHRRRTGLQGRRLPRRRPRPRAEEGRGGGHPAARAEQRRHRPDGPERHQDLGRSDLDAARRRPRAAQAHHHRADRRRPDQDAQPHRSGIARLRRLPPGGARCGNVQRHVHGEGGGSGRQGRHAGHHVGGDRP